MSPSNSRKTFFAQLLGLLAVIGLNPKLLAKSAGAAAAPILPPAPFAIRPETRAVARQSQP